MQVAASAAMVHVQENIPHSLQVHIQPLPGLGRLQWQQQQVESWNEALNELHIGWNFGQHSDPIVIVGLYFFSIFKSSNVTAMRR